MGLSTLQWNYFFPLKALTLLLCDKVGAIHLSFNHVQYSRMNNIQIDLYFTCGLVYCDTFYVCHVHTQNQIVHLLTKPLFKKSINYLNIKIGLADKSSILQGSIRAHCNN
jgi:hypothetical protein